MPYGGYTTMTGGQPGSTEGKACAIDGKTVCFTDTTSSVVNVVPTDNGLYDHVSILNGTDAWVRAVIITDPNATVGGNKTGLVAPGGGTWSFGTAGKNAVSGVDIVPVETPTVSAGLCIDPNDLTPTALSPLCSGCVVVEFLEQ